jgi:eukaryotic-like serine/threonine-protein kinase
MRQEPTHLSVMRRRALDILLSRYFELSPEEQAIFLRESANRWPRLTKYFNRLIDRYETVSPYFESFYRLADQVADEAEPESAPPLDSGTHLGSWQVDEVVGKGGMGTVYQGRRADGAFEMVVAIKLLRLSGGDLSEYLQRECRLLARLSHPAVTRLLDAGMDDRVGPFLVMEWVEGEDLHAWLERDPPMQQRLDIFERVCRAVDHAHQRLVIHGDIKPGNVRVETRGSVKLMDFGIAKLMSQDGQAPRALAMTPGFAAPEVVQGYPMSPRSDIWSLGALLAWMTKGQVSGHDDKFKPVVPWSNVECRELQAIIAKACHDSPDGRYASVSEMLADLRRHRSNFPVGALPQSRWYIASKFIKRNTRGISALAAVMLIGVAGVAGVVWQAAQTQREAERALAAVQRTEAVRDYLIDMVTAIDPWVSPGEAPTVKDVLDQRRETIIDDWIEHPDIAVQLLEVVGSSYIGLGDRPAAMEVLEAAVGLIDDDKVPHLDAHEIAQVLFAYATASPDSEYSAEVARRALSLIEHTDQFDGLKAGLTGLLAYDKFVRGDAESAVSIGAKSIDLACDPGNGASEACVERLSDQFHYLMHLIKYEQALEVAERAFEKAKELHQDSTHPRVINAGVPYGEALMRVGQPRKAIEHFAELREIGLRIYGKDNIHDAYILFRLAQAHVFVGQHPKAVTLLTEALHKVVSEQPDHRAIPIQVSILIDALLHMYQFEDIDHAYARFMPEVPDNVAVYAKLLIRVNEFRRMALSGSVEPYPWNELREFMGQLNDFQRLYTLAAIAGLQASLKAGDEERAEYWFLRLGNLPEEDAGLPSVKIVKARHLLQGAESDKARAFDYLERALDALKEAQQREGPLRARALALKAEWHCRQNKLNDGRRLLSQALEFWHGLDSGEAGARAMRNLAGACKVSGHR